MAEEKKISVKQIKSVTGSKRNQRLSLKGLGLKKSTMWYKLKTQRKI